MILLFCHLLPLVSPLEAHTLCLRGRVHQSWGCFIHKDCNGQYSQPSNNVEDYNDDMSSTATFSHREDWGTCLVKDGHSHMLGFVSSIRIGVDSATAL